MAGSFIGRVSPDNTRGYSRQRLAHERQPLETSRRREHTHRSQHGRHREASGRRSSLRQTDSPSSHQFMLPLSAPPSSTLSFDAQVESTSGFMMERTPSGNSIISESSHEGHNHTLNFSDEGPACSDEQAASDVENHFRQHPIHRKSERILRSLVESNTTLDDDALDGIITAADSLFFHGELSGRVRWDWSSPDQQRYQTELIGTTALRRSAKGGIETLIVLSDPILKHPAYARRLLLSTFLHELIHCYLFIRCGFSARAKGGHTQGFHRIAAVIDSWAGNVDLRLCNMKANLNHFLVEPPRPTDPRLDDYRSEGRHVHEGCNQSPRPHRDFEERDIWRERPVLQAVLQGDYI